jgi:teichuronic acid exporter
MDTTTAIQESPPGAGVSVAPPLGRSVGRGLGSLVSATLATKAVTFGSQVVLAWILTKSDFGEYAIAIGLSGLAIALRDAGVRELIVARGERYYRAMAGPIFWMAMAANIVAAALLAGVAPLLANIYDAPHLTSLLMVIALSLPLGTPGSILQCKLRMDLRFGELSRISIGSALIRSLLPPPLALLGLGPMSFVLPMLASAVFEWIASYTATRDRPWRRPPDLLLWPVILGETKWLMFGVLANILMDNGDYVVAALIVPSSVVGVYYFGFQIVAQIAATLAFNVKQVLFPALVKLNAEPERQREALLRALRVVMFIACPACLGLATLIRPLEYVLWQGRWIPVVAVVQALCVFFPWRITFGITMASQQARGHFRLWAVLTFVEGLGIMAAAGIGAEVGRRMGGKGEYIAMAVGAWMALSRAVVTMHKLRRVGIGRRERLGAVTPAWLAAIAACAITTWADDVLGIESGRWLRLWDALDRGSEFSYRGAGLITQSLRAVLMGGLFSAIYLGLARLFLKRQLVQTLLVLPGRIARPALRLLGLESYAAE